MQESSVVSNWMDGFPPIYKEDPPDVRAQFVYEHWKTTGETIKYYDIPDTMYGGALPVAKKRKSKKKATSEAVDEEEEEASEPKPKRAKKEKGASSVQKDGSVTPTIQDEVQDLEPDKVLTRRTRSGISIGSSQPLPPQPSIPKKKRKQIRKMILQEENEEIEDATQLVIREVKRKKVADEAVLQKA